MNRDGGTVAEAARNAIESEYRTSKIDNNSEMDRNTIQSNFETCKMACRKI